MNTTPIEFMAWDKKRNMFMPQGEIIFSDYGDTRWIVNPNAIEYIHDNCDESDRFVLMQLTALRSINNEPIYNHMIVRDDTGRYYLVDMFNYYLMYNLANYYIKLEIVGNRFQHPELLELCK